MSSSIGRTRNGASTRPCTSAWNAKVSLGHGEKPNVSSRTRQFLDQARRGLDHGGKCVVETPAAAILFVDLVGDYAHFDGRHARQLRRPQDAEPFHGLDVAAR